MVVWSHTQSDRNTFWDLQVCRLQSFQCSTSKGANWDGSGIWPGHHLCFGHVQLEGDSWAHKGHAIEMMSLSWLTNDSHQMGWRSLSRCVKVHDALIILHNKQDSPCVKAMRPLLLLSSTLIVWWNPPQTPGRLCKWLILTFRLFSKALSSVSEAYWLPSHSNWSRWRVQVALVQMAHYLQHIALTAAAASFTQTVSTWLSPADLNLLIKTQWAHFKSSALRSRSAAGQKRGLEMTMLMSFFVLPLLWPMRTVERRLLHCMKKMSNYSFYLVLLQAYITQQCLGTIVISIVIFNWPWTLYSNGCGNFRRLILLLHSSSRG